MGKAMERTWGAMRQVQGRTKQGRDGRDATAGAMGCNGTAMGKALGEEMGTRRGGGGEGPRLPPPLAPHGTPRHRHLLRLLSSISWPVHASALQASQATRQQHDLRPPPCPQRRQSGRTSPTTQRLARRHPHPSPPRPSPPTHHLHHHCSTCGSTPSASTNASTTTMDHSSPPPPTPSKPITTHLPPPSPSLMIDHPSPPPPTSITPPT